MNVKTAGQAIRDTVDMEQILDLYGYRVRRGFMCCPFHGEKEPSLKVYGGTKGWHCFGCGRGGSVIDFVMEQEGCSFLTAVWAIDNALNLGLNDPHEYPETAMRNRRLQDSLDEFVGAVYAYCDALIRKIEGDQVRGYHRLKALEEACLEDKRKLTAEDWTFLHTWKEEDLYNSYRIEKILEFKEEVAAWRRKARK